MARFSVQVDFSSPEEITIHDDENGRQLFLEYDESSRDEAIEYVGSLCELLNRGAQVLGQLQS